MNTAAPDPGNLYLVVGYDGSPPAVRALDAAVRLLRDRPGRIDVVYVGQLPGVDMLSADAVSEMEETFDEIGRDLKVQATEQLRGREERWQFEQRRGLISENLLATADAIAAADPDSTVSIVVGGSSSAAHRLVGSIPVHLARHSPVPILIVP